MNDTRLARKDTRKNDNLREKDDPQMGQNLQNLLRDTLLDTLYPRRCPVCQKIITQKGSLICRSCESELPFIHDPYCMRCGKPIAHSEEELCIDCRETEHEFLEGRAVFLYEKQLRASVVRMKFENKREYIDYYAYAMAASQKQFILRCAPDMLIPIPMHKKKRKERGFDQCRLLAEKLSVYTGIPCRGDIISRERYTLPQKGLNRQERNENLHGAFRISDPSLLGRSILLIDDIYTTGSTIDEAARCIHRVSDASVRFLSLCIGKGKETV